MSTQSETTRVTQLTPPGRAAVAVVLVEGPAASTWVDALLHRADGKRLADFPSGRIVVGRWGAVDGEELVVCQRAPNLVEVHCHGGTAAVEAVVGGLCALGCELTSWQEQIRHTVADPICAAAQIALADAPTARTAAILLDQMQGALTAAVRRVASAAEQADWPTAIATLQAVLAHRGVGLHLTKPWRVVLAGRPNVGKSSLLNALVGFDRAIVYDQPGTTRDVVTALTAIDGWPVRLADTAGLRETRDEIEAAGVERANSAAADADLVLLVDHTPAGGAVALPAGIPVLRVLNKIDLHPRLSENDRQQFDACVSAVEGTGVASLADAIGRALVPAPPAAGIAVAFESEHISMLEPALEFAQQANAPAVHRCLQPLLTSLQV